jgi:hypothetical protein
MTKYSIQDERIDAFLYANYKLLLRNLEYHLLGNHLLENAFSLLFGAYFFHDIGIYQKAQNLLILELKEQILSDGAHFELSPMYHQIILHRLLDSINLLQNNKVFNEQGKLLIYLKEKSLFMVLWLNMITFFNGKIPFLNDTTHGIAPTTKQLNQYALNLEVITEENIARKSIAKLSESGYRCFKNNIYECIIDIGQIGPTYLPAHAHADTFNFVLNVHNAPVIIDMGISTYNQGVTRLYERGTAAHNTVSVLGKNSSEIWVSFRVARRANVKIIVDQDNCIIAQHDGYRRQATIHQRQWNFSDKKVEIIDKLKGKIKNGKAHFHFAPGLKPEKNGTTIKIGNQDIFFENTSHIEIIRTRIPDGYNKFVENTKLEVTFDNFLKTSVVLSEY